MSKSDNQMPTRFASEGTYFIHQETGEEWNEERVTEFRDSLLSQKAELNKKLAEVGNELAEVKHKLSKSEERFVQLSSEHTRINDEQFSTKETLRRKLRENETLSKAVSELKSFLFQKELTIAQNSGYIQRIRELDPAREERLVEVPVHMVNFGNSASQLMATESYHGQNTWGQRWWDIGKEKE